MGKFIKYLRFNTNLFTFCQSSKKYYTLISFCKKPSTNTVETLSYERIDENLETAYKQAMAFRIKKATRQVFKPSEVRLKKKEIARLLTARRKTQIAEGIDRATYR